MIRLQIAKERMRIKTWCSAKSRDAAFIQEAMRRDNSYWRSCSNWPDFFMRRYGVVQITMDFLLFLWKITEQMKGRMIGFSLDTGADDIWNTDNPQTAVYVNGVLTCAMDLNHHEVILVIVQSQEKIYDIRLYAYVNSPGKSNFFIS